MCLEGKNKGNTRKAEKEFITENVKKTGEQVFETSCGDGNLLGLLKQIFFQLLIMNSPIVES